MTPGDGGVHEPAGDVGGVNGRAQVREVALEGLAVLVGIGPRQIGRLYFASPRLREPVAEGRVLVEVGGRRAGDVAELEPAQAVRM